MKFLATINYRESVTVEVEADSEPEAEQKALKLADAIPCTACSVDLEMKEA